MKIFRVDGDPKYQTLTRAKDISLYPKVGGPPYASENGLAHVELYRLMPFRREGDFRGTGRFFSCKEPVLDSVIATLHSDAQALPVTVDDEDKPSFLIYPVNVLDAADVPSVKRRQAAQGGSWPPCYEFKRDVFHRPQLFTVPLFDVAIFYATDLGNPERDFYVRYRELELTGLVFEQVWEA